MNGKVKCAKMNSFNFYSLSFFFTLSDTVFNMPLQHAETVCFLGA